MTGPVYRDRDREAWNDALASHDPDRIKRTQHAILDRVFARIMGSCLHNSYHQPGECPEAKDGGR